MFGNQLRHISCHSMPLSFTPFCSASLAHSLALFRPFSLMRDKAQTWPKFAYCVPQNGRITSVAGSTSWRGEAEGRTSGDTTIKWQSLMRHFRGSCCLLIAYKTHSNTHAHTHTQAALTHACVCVSGNKTVFFLFIYIYAANETVVYPYL